ncbi:MAG: hypothetical protein RJB66_141 [Pseudomonadota bacterium]|jgi:NADP-dependent 3-hydroxy acid dehydrogenase YdfG
MLNQKKGLAFISGASSGIGRSTAITLAQQGYDLLLMARRENKLNDLKLEISQLNASVTINTHVGDVQCKEDIQSLCKTFDNELKTLSVLINNAGLAKGTEPFHSCDPQDWDTMIDTNIKGLLYLTRSLLPKMLTNNFGHVINLGSVAGRWVYPGGSVYCATKFAVRAITEGLRQDLCGTNIRITNIEPGMVETEFSLVRLGTQEEANAVYAGMTPLKAEDIAETISWCLSRPPHVNIQELVLYPTAQAAIRQVHRT